MITVDGTTALAIWSLTYFILQLAVWVWTLRDVWRERWNGKFRDKRDFDEVDLFDHQYAENDWEAFRDSLTDETVPHIAWHITVLMPLLASGVVTVVWVALTVLGKLLAGVL